MGEVVVYRLHIGFNCMMNLFGDPGAVASWFQAIRLVVVFGAEVGFQNYSAEIFFYVVLEVFLVGFPRIGNEV